MNVRSMPLLTGLRPPGKWDMEGPSGGKFVLELRGWSIDGEVHLKTSLDPTVFIHPVSSLPFWGKVVEILGIHIAALGGQGARRSGLAAFFQSSFNPGCRMEREMAFTA